MRKWSVIQTNPDIALGMDHRDPFMENHSQIVISPGPTRPGKQPRNELERSTMLWKWVNSLFLWAMFNSYFDITRGYTIIYSNKSHYINPIKSHWITIKSHCSHVSLPEGILWDSLHAQPAKTPRLGQKSLDWPRSALYLAHRSGCTNGHGTGRNRQKWDGGEGSQMSFRAWIAYLYHQRCEP